MKKLNFLFVFLSFLFLTTAAYSTTWTVTAAGISFTPANITVTVGDTVKWQWVEGIHTTTSTTIPSGAASWNAPLDAANQIYRYVVTHPGVYNYVCTPHITFGMTGVINASPIGIKPMGTGVPDAYNLSQNFPNPFNPATNIQFDIPKSTIVKLAVYNLIGQQEALLFNGELNAGSYNVDWDASSFPSGVYFYRLTTIDFSETKRMVLVK